MTERSLLVSRSGSGRACAIAIVQLLVHGLLGSDAVAPDAPIPVGLLGGVVGALLIVLWWLFFSRARWSERIGAIALDRRRDLRDQGHRARIDRRGRPGDADLHPADSVLTPRPRRVGRGERGRFRRGAGWRRWRRPCWSWRAPFAMIRTDGVSSGGELRFHWRWTPTAEERLLAEAARTSRSRCRRAARCGDADGACRDQASSAPRACRRHRCARRASSGERRRPKLPSRQRPTAPAMSERASGDARPHASRMAWLPRTRSRQRDSRRADQYRLVGVAAGADLAPADRTGLVVVLGERRSALHAGATRRRRDGRRATGCRRASRCGGTAIRSASTSRTAAPVRARHRPSTTAASIPLAPPES